LVVVKLIGGSGLNLEAEEVNWSTCGNTWLLR